jgi:Uma2 family endonuclease
MVTKTNAAIEDLYHIPEHGKAELVKGEIVRQMPTGGRPGRAGLRIASRLMDYEQAVPNGRTLPDNTGYRVNLPNRESFSPDVSFYFGPHLDMRFIDGAPDFAVEIRSEGDYGSVMEAEMEEKRADYFAAGTRVVWDVGLLHEPIIRKFVTGDPVTPAAVYRRGETADAEPALPGWIFLVDDLFR